MTRTAHRSRTPRAAARLALWGLSASALLGAAACQPAPQPAPPPTTGKVAVTVSFEGEPVDAHLSLMRIGAHRSVRTGSDGAVTVTLAPGTWTVAASASGAPHPTDPLCHTSLASDPDPTVSVAAGRTATLAVVLEAGPMVCT